MTKFEIKKGVGIIPDSVTEVGERAAFWERTDLKKVVITGSVTKIGRNAFLRCTGLTEIVIPDSVTEIERYAFSGCTGLTEIVIPDSVTKIGERAFSGCTGLTKVVIPHAVKEIEEGVFSRCTGLTEIVIPDSVTKIGEEAFSGCTGLTKVVIPHAVEEIGKETFKGCTALAEINIPDLVEEIGKETFKDCTSLTKVAIPDSVTRIGWYAFAGCTADINIPDSVEEIGRGAFQDCTGLTKVVIPEWVTYIAHETFYGCTELTEVIIPDAVEEIGKRVFENCKNLKTIYIPANKTEYFKSILPLWLHDKLVERPVENSTKKVKKSTSVPMKKLTVSFYGTGIRIDVYDSDDELIRCYNALNSISEVSLMEGDKKTELKDYTYKTMYSDSAEEEYEKDFKINDRCILDERMRRSLDDPQEQLEDVDAIYWAQTNVYGDAVIELPESEEFDVTKFCVMLDEFVLPESEEDAYRWVIYDGKQYPIELDLDTEVELSKEKIWCADGDWDDDWDDDDDWYDDDDEDDWAEDNEDNECLDDEDLDALKNDVREDLKAFVSSCKSAANEKELRNQLVEYLNNSGKYDKVLCGYPIQSMDKMRVDVAVKSAGRTVVVEVKYVTKAQGAAPKNSYLFWRNIYRLEQIKGSLNYGGFSLFVTDNPAYEKCPKEDANYVKFTMAANNPNATIEKQWLDETKEMAKANPGFMVDEEHCQVQAWNDAGMAGFRYCMIEI